MRINFTMRPIVELDKQAVNVKHSESLGLPKIGKAECWNEHPLAVIGAGPSVADHVEELRNWPGDRWAINGASRWCHDNGIEAAFLTIDPAPQDVSYLRPGDKALLASCCDPQLFAELGDCDVTVFDLNENGMTHMSTSVTAAFTLGPLTGHRQVVFFGCEASYAGTTHVNENEPLAYRMLIKSNGDVFLSNPQMFIQADGMSQAIRKFPHVYSERSGGLLRAMVESGGHDVIGVSQSVRDILDVPEDDRSLAII